VPSPDVESLHGHEHDSEEEVRKSEKNFPLEAPAGREEDGEPEEIGSAAGG
jgi:hypothetical protein